MKERPDYIRLDNDCVVVRVEVSIPWADSSLCYQHVFDHPGLREEFAPIPEVHDPFQYYRRKELLDRRAKSVEAIANTITRSLLHAMDKERKP